MKEGYVFSVSLSQPYLLPNKGGFHTNSCTHTDELLARVCSCFSSCYSLRLEIM